MMLVRILVYIRNFEIFLLLILLTSTCLLLLNNVWTALNNNPYQKQSVPIEGVQKTSSAASPYTEKYINTIHLKTLIKCHDQVLNFERMQYGNYWILKNYVRGRLSESVGCAETITYTTNADYLFLDNLLPVVSRWLAPVSLALFAPGYDFNFTMDSIQYLRNCLPQSDLIRLYVTFHIYFPNDHMPAYVPFNEEEALQWPFDCQMIKAPYERVKRSDMYKTKLELFYPINVGRNIARRAVNTYFIFASDIELYPSRGLVQQFMEMLVHNDTEVLETLAERETKLRVFSLPIFEIKKGSSIPDTKEEILTMLQNKTAVVFHSFVCRNCHLVPGYDDWQSGSHSFNNNLDVIAVGKREGKYAYWEPFYISDNKEPWFDERITWEGHCDKRIQNYAMCLMNYDYFILHPAFLVHRPGIKRFNRKDPLLKFVSSTNRLINQIIKPEYKILYGRNNKCHV